MPKIRANYLSTAADGSISAQFAGGVGMVAADGAIPAVNPPADRALSWHKDTVTGALVADILAGVTPSGLTGELQALVKTVPGNAQAAVYQRAVDTDPAQTYVEVSAQQAAKIGVVRIIDANGVSDLARVTPYQNPAPPKVAPWVDYGSTLGGLQYAYSHDGVVTVTGLVKTTAGAFFTQNVATGLPAPLNPELVWWTIGHAGAGFYPLRFDVDGGGNLIFVDGNGFPNGTIIDYVTFTGLVYQAASRG